ncbi:MAG: ATP-binding protein [Selenomonadaceae bacterium]|nr:ATP-binding protein [Selenomonadaceae bacterium]
MANYIFGVNILENLTTGMYRESQIIFREYIQNACDAIDKAISQKILAAGEGRIEIWIDTENRQISIEDNGAGISADEFETTLQSIAQSSKQIDTEKGFRGIGRLCGLAYCKELIFSSTAKGENIISVMKLDAQKLRGKFYGKKKYTAQEVLDEIITVEKISAADITSKHWFKVELLDINSENETLLDVQKVTEYLSFVAPVEYKEYFFFQSKIYEHAAALNFKIDEYKIYINGEQIVKNYKTTFKTSLGEDDIFDVAFEDFYDDAGNLIAWLWIGLSKFKAVISQKKDTSSYKMRALRLRKGNIQIGEADSLQNLFKEERGTYYFIGEVFAVDKKLIPNSQRDYFVENPELKNFESALREYFKELYKIYYQASNFNSAVRAVQTYETAKTEFQNKTFVTPKQKIDAEKELDELEEKAEIANKKIERFQNENSTSAPDILSRVIFRIIDKAEKISTPPPETEDNKFKNLFPNLNRSERKLVTKILDVIRENVDVKTFKILQEKIVEAVNQ